MRNYFVVVLCFLVVLGILAGALWPFTPHPQNEVSWAPGGWGLRFGDYASIQSSEDVRRPENRGENCSLEIWLTPGLTDDSNVILAYAPRENPGQFRIGQSGDSLYVSRQVERGGTVAERPYIAIQHVFRQHTPILLTLTAGGKETRVYLNGTLALARPDFGFSADDLTGKIVVANSPTGNNSWSGLLQGIAVYGSELSPEQVALHYKSWATLDAANVRTFGTDTLYLFQEGAGKVVHNLGASRQPDLVIPDSYRIVYPTFLHPFWKDFYSTRSRFEDMESNVLAFIPLGFLLSATLRRVCPDHKALWLSILAGSLLSLTIESVQYFLPMRCSDSMDWLTNSAGTIIGAWLFFLQSKRNWLGRLPFIGRVWAGLFAAYTRVPLSAGSDGRG